LLISLQKLYFVFDRLSLFHELRDSFIFIRREWITSTVARLNDIAGLPEQISTLSLFLGD